MSDKLIRHVARALNPDRPISALAELAKRPRSTARSWTSGRRRPPVAVLKALLEAIKERHSALLALMPVLDHAILKATCRRRCGIAVGEQGGCVLLAPAVLSEPTKLALPVKVFIKNRLESSVI